MRHVVLPLVTAAALLLPGCTLDLIEPDLFAARLFVTLVQRPAEGEDTFFLDAKLEPGIGREGRRQVPEPSLAVNSVPHLPSAVAEGDPPAEFGWRIDLAPAASPQETIRIQPPGVTGLSEPSALELPAAVALLPEGPITLGTGEDLVLHLVPPPGSQSFMRWSLSLTNRQAGPPFLLTLEGVGIWPAEIRVPASHLPQTTAFQLNAVVRVIAEYEPSVRAEGYDLTGRIDFVMERIVTGGEGILSTSGASD